MFILVENQEWELIVTIYLHTPSHKTARRQSVVPVLFQAINLSAHIKTFWNSDFKKSHVEQNQVIYENMQIFSSNYYDND